MNPRTLLLLVAVLAAAGARAGTIPADCDQWSEYPDAAAAEQDGWLRECGIAQQVTVSNDCCMGLSSVGCRTTRAYWCDEFGIEKSVSLDGAVGFEFWHKADWAGWNFAVRIYQQPSAEESVVQSSHVEGGSTGTKVALEELGTGLRGKHQFVPACFEPARSAPEPLLPTAPLRVAVDQADAHAPSA